mgnify:CR=1 FL=1
MSEKNTDHFMQSHYQSIFNAMYHTEANNEYFNSKIPASVIVPSEDLI